MPQPYRAALVTGASSGIGRAIAIALRGAGMNVFALGRDAEALAALEAQCGATRVVGDVRDRARRPGCSRRMRSTCSSASREQDWRW